MEENQQDKTESKLTVTEEKFQLLSSKEQDGPDRPPNPQIEEVIEQLKGLGYKVTEEYSNSGQLSRVSGEHRQRKTLWDWLQLLIIPVVLTLVSFGLGLEQSQISEANSAHQTMLQQTASAQQHLSDQQSTLDQQRATILQTYIGDIQDLLLNHNLLQHKATDDVGILARARTLTAMKQLDGKRNAFLTQFLQDAHLIGNNSGNIVSFSGADLSSTDLSGADLSGVDLSNANLSNANLSGANLSDADLSRADLSRANFSSAILDSANLTEANLAKAQFINAYLGDANLGSANFTDTSFKNANLRGAYLSLAGAGSSYYWCGGPSASDPGPCTIGELTQEQLDQVYSCQGATLRQGLTCHKNR